MIVHVAPPRHPPQPVRADSLAPRLPLYLRGRKPTWVGVDGPAFLVRRQDKADARYPFSRIARIISGPGVEWSGRALGACLAQDIPVVFLDRDGHPAGYLHAWQRHPSRLDTVLTELLDRPDGFEHYALWLRAERMRTLQDWQRSLSLSGKTIDMAEFSALVHRYVYRTDDSSLGMWAEDLYRGALSAYVLQQLQRCGARPLYWCHDARPLHLANDLASLLLLHLALEMRGFGDRIHGDEAAMLTVLHKLGEKVQTLCGSILGRLHKHIRELLEQWH